MLINEYLSNMEKNNWLNEICLGSGKLQKDHAENTKDVFIYQNLLINIYNIPFE